MHKFQEIRQLSVQRQSLQSNLPRVAFLFIFKHSSHKVGRITKLNACEREGNKERTIAVFLKATIELLSIIIIINKIKPFTILFTILFDFVCFLSQLRFLFFPAI